MIVIEKKIFVSVWHYFREPLKGKITFSKVQLSGKLVSVPVNRIYWQSWDSLLTSDMTSLVGELCKSTGYVQTGTGFHISYGKYCLPSSHQRCAGLWCGRAQYWKKRYLFLLHSVAVLFCILFTVSPLEKKNIVENIST